MYSLFKAKCGARTTLDEDFFKVDEICTSKKKSELRKKFDQAIEVLKPILDRCAEYIDIFENINLTNELAVAYKNLNKKDDCLNVLWRHNELAGYSEKEIKEGYSSGDAEKMLALSKKLKFNISMCKKLK